jgi:hypothetical protein
LEKIFYEDISSEKTTTSKSLSQAVNEALKVKEKKGTASVATLNHYSLQSAGHDQASAARQGGNKQEAANQQKEETAKFVKKTAKDDGLLERMKRNIKKVVGRFTQKIVAEEQTSEKSR